MTTTAAAQHDPYLQFAKDYAARPRGLSIVEAWRERPGRRLTRTRMMGHTVAEQTVQVPAGLILCPGAASIRIAESGLVEHVSAWNIDEGSFAGFVVTPVDGDRAVVQVRGCFVLMVPGSAAARPGAQVFAAGVNDFNLDAHGLPIGVLLHRENLGGGARDSWQVLFAAAGEQLDLERVRAVGWVPSR